MAVCFIVAVGATTSRYAAIITEMNVFFREEIVVTARKVVIIQGFPIGGAIPQSVVDDITKVDGVEKVVPMIFSLDFKMGEVSSIVPINASIGLPLEEFSMIVGSASLRAGGRLPLENVTNEVVVGASIADQYGISQGSRIMLKDQELAVCGIIEGPSALLGRSIIMRLELAQEIFRYPMQISMAIVRPKPNVTQEKLASAIEREISYVMALTEKERNDLTRPILEVVEHWNMAIQGVLLFLCLVLVSILGMINVSERRRDFATLDAIGAPLSHIYRLVLLETSLIGALGGILGIFFGSIIAIFLASFYTSIPLSQFLPSIFEIVSPLYMMQIFLAVVFVSCLGGIIPAINATKMRTAEVLRAEY